MTIEFLLMILHFFKIETRFYGFFNYFLVFFVLWVSFFNFLRIKNWISFENFSHESHIFMINLHSLTFLVNYTKTSNWREIRRYHVVMNDTSVSHMFLSFHVKKKNLPFQPEYHRVSQQDSCWPSISSCFSLSYEIALPAA